MIKYEVYAYSNDALLTQFMSSRDNLIHFRVASLQCPSDATIKEMLSLEEQEYQMLKEEIYRRMKSK